MPNVQPLNREDLAEFEPMFKMVEGAMGFVPRSMLTMARRPDILRGFATLSMSVLAGGTVDRTLKQLIAMIASVSAGCRYCQAHTSASAARSGASEEKVEAVFDFETSPLFDDAERAALRIARDAALVPNATTPDHFAALRAHFNDEQIVEIVATISLFGWLNRWNDTMATELEEEPAAFASGALAGHGWEPGKHGTSSQARQPGS